MRKDTQPGKFLMPIKQNRLLSFSNPMDWKPIDRLILLASLVFIAPLSFGSSLLIASHMASDFLNQELAKYFLYLYVLHMLLLLGFIFEALRRRRQGVLDWPVFENFIIGSYIIVVMSSAYVTGTHFVEGLLLLFLGVNITCTLGTIDKIRLSYWFVVPMMLLMGIADFIHSIPFAILFDQPPIHDDGRPMFGWLIIRGVIVTALSSLIYLCILAMRRWSERESLYREMSTIDGLTRLSNRNSFINRGEEEIERVQHTHTQAKMSLSCIMIDLDHFKQINDTWGHHAGDAVLVATSKIMMSSARKYDEVGRYGGEEFAILLPRTDIKNAARVAEKVRQEISQAKIKIENEEILVTASFGVACYPSRNVESMNDLLKVADKALYEAKETGRNKVVIA